MITERCCRVCGGELDTVLNWGTLYLSDFPLPDETPKGTAPFDFCACRLCGLVQLRHTVDPDTLFRRYFYRSSVNEVMQAELRDIVRQACDRIQSWRTADLVVDIGANDGELLRHYRDYGPAGLLRVAFEPALNFNEPLHRHCDVLVPQYFPQGLAQAHGMEGRVKVLTSIAMIYACDDPQAVVAAADALLTPDGVWVIQFQDLAAMLRQTAFDNITPEHLWYPSLAAIERLLTDTNLHIVAAERRAINGGSLRLCLQRRDQPVALSVEPMRAAEAGCEAWDTLQQFAWRVGERTAQLQGLLLALHASGHTVDIYACSTKFNTLSQVVGIGPNLVRWGWERTPEKVGRHTVTGIPMISEEQGRADPPDSLLLGAWQFREAFLQREAAYLAAGHAMIVPLPAVEVIQEPIHV